MTVLAAHRWKSNAELIADVASLGYLRSDDSILDVTWGLGTFWKRWTPTRGRLVGTDLNPKKSQTGASVDFTALPWDAEAFDVVVLDPPYKLNGTTRAQDKATDHRYGVDDAMSRDERHDLIFRGIKDCARVASRCLLVKCQAQVEGNKVRWQDRMFADAGEAEGFELVDRFDLLGKHRPQPMEGRVQRHAHGRPSTLLVFERVRAVPATGALVAPGQLTLGGV